MFNQVEKICCAFINKVLSFFARNRYDVVGSQLAYSYTPKNMPATNALLQEGRYRINNEFPHEGTGSVYDAYDTVSETNVVVKEIPVKLNKVATMSQRENLNIAFADQAKVLTEIRHDSLLHVRDYFSEIGRQYLVMESVDGDDLQALLDRQKSCFPLSDVTNWADQLLDALYYLHTYQTPIIHRNLRPANIKLSSDGKIKLMSFGLVGSDTQVNTAIAENVSEGSSIAYSPLEQIWNGLDAASQKVVTSKYDEQSERILKEDLDARSDIYSLGATLYHLVTARVPVDALERSIEILEGRADPLRVPSNIDPTIPPEISDVLMKAMAIKREYRFDSAAIMRQVLRTALVRVKEREAEELLEQDEAANDIKLAEEKKLNSVTEQPSETERMRQQLQEAEAQRLLAELRAADAEKRLLESEAARQSRPEPAVVIANIDDDLLGVLGPSLHVSEAPKAKVSADQLSFTSVDDDAEVKFASPREHEISSEQITVPETNSLEPETSVPATEQIVPAETHFVEEEVVVSPTEEVAFAGNDSIEEEQSASTTEEVSFSENVTVEEEIEESPTEVIAAAEYDSAEEKESTEPVTEELSVAALMAQVESKPREVRDEVYVVSVERGGFPLGMPAIAIGAAVLLVIAIGSWMLTSSATPEPTKITSTESTSSTQTAPIEPAVKSAFQPTDAPATGQPESAQPDPASTEPAASDPSTVKAMPAATPKPKKPAATAVKTPAQKKAVTVDDLINDN